MIRRGPTSQIVLVGERESCFMETTSRGSADIQDIRNRLACRGADLRCRLQRDKLVVLVMRKQSRPAPLRAQTHGVEID
jgi:hypothetical protein